MINYEVLVSYDEIVHTALFAYCDPKYFESVVEEEKWKDAMDAKIKFIEKDDTCELPDLLQEHIIKWVCKMKLKCEVLKWQRVLME